MANHEGAIIARVLIEATRKGWRLFRNSVGMAWQGRITEEQTMVDKNGAPVHVVELAAARRVNYGLARGSSDLVGWRPLVITEDMVGQTVAQFVSVECKTKAYSRTTDEQDIWLGQVAQSGGAAYLAREQKAGEVDMIQVEKKNS
jgi:hypothetical protein